LDGPDPRRHVKICPDTRFDLNRCVRGRHGLGTLLEAILNLVEAAMTSTDLLEVILNSAEFAMTSMDLLEANLMSMDLLEATMRTWDLLEAILNLLDQLEDMLILCRHVGVCPSFD
jgi:uncharacterized protein YjbI with pentapeptide repeats